MTTKGTRPGARARVLARTGTRPAFDRIGAAGCCVIAGCGQVMRAPPESLTFGGSPVIQPLGTEPLVVAKISEDPCVPSSRARLVAAGLDLEVNV